MSDIKTTCYYMPKVVRVRGHSRRPRTEWERKSCLSDQWKSMGWTSTLKGREGESESMSLFVCALENVFNIYWQWHRENCILSSFPFHSWQLFHVSSLIFDSKCVRLRAWDTQESYMRRHEAFLWVGTKLPSLFPLVRDLHNKIDQLSRVCMCSMFWKSTLSVHETWGKQ